MINLIDTVGFCETIRQLNKLIEAYIQLASGYRGEYLKNIQFITNELIRVEEELNVVYLKKCLYIAHDIHVSRIPDEIMYEVLDKAMILCNQDNILDEKGFLNLSKELLEYILLKSIEIYSFIEKDKNLRKTTYTTLRLLLRDVKTRIAGSTDLIEEINT